MIPSDDDAATATTTATTTTVTAGFWQELAAAECRAFLRTFTGRAELRNTTTMVREQRRRQLQLAAGEAAVVKAGDPRGRSLPGMKTIR